MALSAVSGAAVPPAAWVGTASTISTGRPVASRARVRKAWCGRGVGQTGACAVYDARDPCAGLDNSGSSPCSSTLERSRGIARIRGRFLVRNPVDVPFCILAFDPLPATG